jgi:glucans biosynthesis protein C
MTRRYDLDWVRVGAFALLVPYHVGMYYVSWDWHVKSPAASTALEPLMMLTAPWRLGLLFVVSGVASAYLLARREASFVRERSGRLLIPLLFGMLVIVPPQAYFEVVEKAGYLDGYLAFWWRYLNADDSFCRNADCLSLPTWNHLWFVAYLWVYSVALALFLKWRWLRGHVRRALDRLLSGVGVLVWPVVWLVIARLALLDRFESTHALVDDFYNHAQYLALFVLGFWLARRDQSWALFERWRWPLALGAIVSYLALAAYFASFADSTPPMALRQTMRAVWALNQWLAIGAIFGFAQRLLPRTDSPTLRWLRAAVFPFYILHQTVIIVLTQAIKPLALRPIVEGPLLIAATFWLCALMFVVIRNARWLRPLFGMR